MNFGAAYRMMGPFEEALSMYKKAIQLTPNSAPAYQNLAAAYGLMGREEEAGAAAAELLRINPRFSVEYIAKTCPHERPADTEQLVQGLRKAGLK
jgi:adenylate cyclase